MSLAVLCGVTPRNFLKAVVDGSITTVYPSDFCGVTTVGAYTFYDCDSLTTAMLPEGVVSIEQFSFCYCSNLTTIWLPATLQKIESEAFGSVKHLSVINFGGTMSAWNAINKAADWISGFTSCSVVCTDGTIPL